MRISDGFEPTRAEHNGLAGHRLNHSAKVTIFMRQLLSTEYLNTDSDTVHRTAVPRTAVVLNLIVTFSTKFTISSYL
eukprot:SAG31_NODE_55_length_29938_cov_9.154027_30_plen_77_part_00